MIKKRMKIILTYPPIQKNPLFPLNNVLPPLGIAYLSACLKEAGYDAMAVDMSTWEWNKVAHFIERERPDVLGASCFTDTRHQAFEVLRIAKRVCPGVTTLIGGPHATFLDEQILSNYHADIVVRGESELTIVKLMKFLSHGQKIERVDGITFKRNNEIIRTKTRNFISDLNSLPLPDYSFFDMKDYRDHNKKSVYSSDKGIGKIWGSIITSRGCPFSCQFCSSSSFWGHCWRGRSAKSIVDEMKMLVDLGVEYLSIADDNFLFDQRRVIDICKRMIEKRIKIPFFCEGRVNNQTRECMQWLKKAGCDLVLFGVESGSPTILKEIDKKITPEQATAAFKMAKEAGLRVGCFLMIGNPNESDKTIKETEDWLDKADIDFPSVALTRVYPNTRLYSLSKEKGFMDDSYWLTPNITPYYTAEHSLLTLRKFQFRIVSKFLRKKGTIPYMKFLFSQMMKIGKRIRE